MLALFIHALTSLPTNPLASAIPFLD